MIAEINQPFQPSLIVLDGVEAFVDGGPMTGKRAKADVFLASTDRIAIDAIGVAVLKLLGSNAAIMKRYSSRSKSHVLWNLAWAQPPLPRST
jgi:uncharacterized protein (DUF362 family)